MSKISDIFDALVIDIAAELPNHNQLTNPYAIEENTSLSLNQGWGLAVGPAVNTFRQLSCKLSVNRSMIITVTRKFFANELNIAGKDNVVKLLLEDQFLLIKMVENETGTFSALVAKGDYSSDSGILSVKA